MKSKIVPMFPTLFLYFTILIQQAVAPPDPPTKEISKAELEKTLLKDAANLKEVQEILNLAINNPEEAQKRIQAYKREQYSKEMLWLLNKIAHTPEQGYYFIRPVLVKIHEILEEKSTTYRSFVQPVWNLLKRISFLTMTCFGCAIRSSGDLTQIVADILREGAAAYNGETPNGTAFDIADKFAEKARKVGDRLSYDGKAGLDNDIMRRRTQPESAFTPPNQAPRNGVAESS